MARKTVSSATARRQVPGVSVARRLAAARRSAAAYARFGHPRPGVLDFANRWGINPSEAKAILDAAFKGYGRVGVSPASTGEDAIVFRGGSREAERGLSARDALRQAGGAFGRAFGFGNLITVP